MRKFRHRSLVVTQRYASVWEARRWGKRLVGRVLLDDGNDDGCYMVQRPGPKYGQLARRRSLAQALNVLDAIASGRALNTMEAAE